MTSIRELFLALTLLTAPPEQEVPPGVCFMPGSIEAAAIIMEVYSGEWIMPQNAAYYAQLYRQEVRSLSDVPQLAQIEKLLPPKKWVWQRQNECNNHQAMLETMASFPHWPGARETLLAVKRQRCWYDICSDIQNDVYTRHWRRIQFQELERLFGQNFLMPPPTMPLEYVPWR